MGLFVLRLPGWVVVRHGVCVTHCVKTCYESENEVLFPPRCSRGSAPFGLNDVSDGCGRLCADSGFLLLSGSDVCAGILAGTVAVGEEGGGVH